MKKLLVLTILSTVSLAEPCFGVDFIRDKIYSSVSTNGIDIGYHYTNNIKISVEPMIFSSNIIDATTSTYLLRQLKQEQLLQLQQQATGQQQLERLGHQIEQQRLEKKLSDLSSKGYLGVLVNLRYHYEFTNTDITPYVNVGIGGSVNFKSEHNFSYKISSGVDLPLSSRVNAFAGYRLLKTFNDYDHGLEFGMKFNL